MKQIKQKGSVIVGIILFGAIVLSALTFYSVEQSKSDSKAKSNELLLGAYNVTGGGTYRLKNSVGLTDTTINLSSFKEPVSNLSYTMTYLNTSIAYGTIDPQTSHSEFVSFSGITQNSDGSAKLTGVTRGLTRTPAGASCTASTTLAQRHAGQSIFILSDSPCHFSEYAVKQNDEVITGSWTVPAPTTGGNPTSKTYVDALVNGGTVSYDRVAVAGTAGETVSAGQVLYLKQTDARWYKAGIALAEASSTVLGIAQGSGTSGNAIASGVIILGLDTNQSGLTAGRNYYLSSTAGTIGTATTTRYIGRARNSTSIYVDTYSDLDRKIFNDNHVFNGTIRFNSAITSLSTSTMATTTINGYNPSGLIASTTLTANANTISVSFPQRESLRVNIFASTTSSVSLKITFNGDTSSNYAIGFSNGEPLIPTFTTGIDPFGNPLTNSARWFVSLNIANPAFSIARMVYLDGVLMGGNSNHMLSTSTGAVWRNTNQITSITLTSSAGSTIGAGSFIKVYGDTSNP